MAKQLVVHRRSDLASLFHSVKHLFEDTVGGKVLRTEISLGEVSFNGERQDGKFTVEASAEDLKPLDDDPNAEPTPVNRVYLMTKNQNLILGMIEETFIKALANGPIVVEDVTIDFATDDASE